ncbi:DUF916 and DUF3324 domain-containing protein [Latilactobacillus fuchuensis]|uniref:DUF916 and DUF3324 domain-containing protein n=1 Tax=Latilactobacillus fuchuensis TaxID=164393 RepID=UPI000704E598|nr:DUF916 and DUF3324 domain-containing protein [Latilactobacillus fuchuensis]
MKKLITQLLLGTLLVVGGLTATNQQVQAATSSDASNTDFEVIPLKPGTQVDTTKNYYDLKIKPGETETLQMQVKNYADHKITIYAGLGNAFTQNGGDMSFKTTAPDVDSSVSPSFTSIATMPKKYQKIELAAREGKNITATVTMPEGSQRGMIYGDWHFIEYAKNKSDVKSQVPGASSNYSYSVGVALHGTNYKVYPELKYEKVEPILNNSQPAMAINLRNTQPMIITGATVKAAITKDGLFSSKHVNTVTNKMIAPNSVMRMIIPWNFDQLKPGKYTVDVTVQGNNLWNQLPMTWKFKKHFTIKSQQVKKINAAALKKPTNKWAYVATAAGVLTLISATAWVKLIKIG